MSIVMTFNIGIAIILASTGKIGTNITQFLFGSILTVTAFDLLMILGVMLVSLAFLYIYRHQLIYATFDEDGARINGIDVTKLNYLFAALTGATVGVSTRITGLLVISSILVIPTAAALNLRRGFFKTPPVGHGLRHHLRNGRDRSLLLHGLSSGRNHCPGLGCRPDPYLPVPPGIMIRSGT